MWIRRLKRASRNLQNPASAVPGDGQVHQYSIKLQRFPFTINKAAQGHHAVVIGKLPLQAIENALIAIVAGNPAAAERTIASNPMATGFIFTEGQDDMQMMLAPLNIAGRKPKIFPNKMIEIELRRPGAASGHPAGWIYPRHFRQSARYFVQASTIIG